MKKNPPQKIDFPAIRKIFAKFSEVKLAYLFGSRATGNFGPMSDYDFAIYLEEEDATKRFNLKMDLYYLLNRKLKDDKIDIVILNESQLPDLKFNIINEGKLIYVKEPYKVLIEPRIINEYIDFNEQLLAHGLTTKL